MQNLKLAAKLLYKNIFLTITFLAFFIYINAMNIIQITYLTADEINNGEAMLFLEGSLRLSIICMVFFMFVSYEYFYKLKASHLDECMNVTKSGSHTLYGNQFLIMLGFVTITALVFIAYNVGVYFYMNVNKMEYIIHILLNILVNIFIISVLGIIVGMCAALTFKRLTTYLLLTLIALLTSGIFENVIFTIFVTLGYDLSFVSDFFSLYTPSLDWTPNFSFGFSLLPYRIELLLTWIFAFSVIVFLKLSKNSKIVFRTCAGICAVICITNVFLYAQPSSKLLMSVDNPSACLNNDYYYYLGNVSKEEASTFKITKYELDMDVTTLLSVKAKLTIDKGNLSTYKFTLYRGYKVKKITDQNNTSLKFQQNGDYIEVENNMQSNLSQIYLSYAGYSPRFYSNSQGICLPGYFPYYPHSGYKKVYNVNRQGFEKVLLYEPVDFTININTSKQVYSNLTENENGSFTGSSNGITFMSGFLGKETVEGIEVIYPYLVGTDYYPDNIEKKIKTFLNCKTDNQVIKKIFILPNLNLSEYESTVLYSDYITAGNIFYLSDAYIMQFINPDKLEFFKLIDLYRKHNESFKEYVAYEASLSDEFTNLKIATMLFEKINLLGETVVLGKADTYIHDDSDTRTIKEFIDQLQ